MASAEVTLQGLPELQKKLDSPDLIGNPVKDALTKAAIIVQNQAKVNATGRPGPFVQTGRLRGSISYSLEGAAIPSWARVGSDVEYAPFVEYGTSKMQSYAFLEPALEQRRADIEGLLVEAAKGIEDNWSRE